MKETKEPPQNFPWMPGIGLIMMDFPDNRPE